MPPPAAPCGCGWTRHPSSREHSTSRPPEPAAGGGAGSARKQAIAREQARSPTVRLFWCGCLFWRAPSARRPPPAANPTPNLCHAHQRNILHIVPVPTETLPPRSLLRDDVYARLRDAIVDGTLAPDEQLRDMELATWLGVSRTPVREALLELARAGLVRATPGKSTVVAPVDPAAVRDAQSVVAAMHALAVREAVARLTPEDLAEMRDANAAFAEAQRRGDVDAALDADERFHRVAIVASGNRAAAQVIAQYEPVLRRAERLRFASHEGEASAERHNALIALCTSGDVDAAADLAAQTWQTLTLPPVDEGDTR
ncbi:MAG: GntR family transcriptional regulator [Microbacterium sp.]|nr:GntR family transcriptional regulator [Microbacterium sp.]